MPLTGSITTLAPRVEGNFSVKTSWSIWFCVCVCVCV
jgi:hypothetical protein